MSGDLTHYMEAVARLRKENEALRWALREVGCMYGGEARPGACDCQVCRTLADTPDGGGAT